MILVSGATGNVGGQVAAQLAAAGAKVRALTREPAGLGSPDGVEVVRGDLTDPDGLDAALDGVDSVFLMWPFFTVDAAPAVLSAIGRHARRIVYLSSTGGGPDGLGSHADAVAFHGAVERLIVRSGPEWTFLRPGGFATNTLAWADQIRDTGTVRWPYGRASRSLIHEADIAAVAVRALTSRGHAGRKYALTGPERLTQIEQARIIGEVIGRPVRWEELSREEARRDLLAAWGDPSFVEGALGAWAGFVTEPELLTSTVEEVTGTPARTFRQWTRDHAAAFERHP